MYEFSNSDLEEIDLEEIKLILEELFGEYHCQEIYQILVDKNDFEYLLERRNLSGYGIGLMELAAFGEQDVFLISNPETTFFSQTYRRHTNFAISDSIPLSVIQSKKVKAKIPKHCFQDHQLQNQKYQFRNKRY